MGGFPDDGEAGSHHYAEISSDVYLCVVDCRRNGTTAMAIPRRGPLDIVCVRDDGGGADAKAITRAAAGEPLRAGILSTLSVVGWGGCEDLAGASARG